MFDYHMHSTVSFDARDSALDMALAAKAAGLKEICFTDHLDYDPLGKWACLPSIRQFTMQPMTI